MNLRSPALSDVNGNLLRELDSDELEASRWKTREDIYRSPLSMELEELDTNEDALEYLGQSIIEDESILAQTEEEITGMKRLINRIVEEGGSKEEYNAETNYLKSLEKKTATIRTDLLTDKKEYAVNEAKVNSQIARRVKLRNLIDPKLETYPTDRELLKTSASAPFAITPFTHVLNCINTAVSYLNQEQVSQFITGTLLTYGLQAAVGQVSSLGMFANTTTQAIAAPVYSNTTRLGM